MANITLSYFLLYSTARTLAKVPARSGLMF